MSEIKYSRICDIMGRSEASHLNLRVVGRNAEPHQSKRHWQLLIHIHNRIFDSRHHLVGGVKAGRPGADDCEAEGTARSHHIVVASFGTMLNTCPLRQALQSTKAMPDSAISYDHRDASLKLKGLL